MTGWFLVLAISAALLAPAGIYLGRIAGGPLGRWIAVIGIAAAAVQVVGLPRWVPLVPGISATPPTPLARRCRCTVSSCSTPVSARPSRRDASGYALTATFTVLVVVALAGRAAPLAAVPGYGCGSADRHRHRHPAGRGASLTNFVGYIAWCLWLLAVAAILVRGRRLTATPAADQARVTGREPAR